VSMYLDNKSFYTKLALTQGLMRLEVKTIAGSKQGAKIAKNDNVVKRCCFIMLVKKQY